MHKIQSRNSRYASLFGAAIAGLGSAMLTLAEPASAQDVPQSCTTSNQFKICVSWNPDGQVPAANVQNLANSSRGVRIVLVDSNANYLAEETVTLAQSQWRGIYKLGVPRQEFCTFAFNPANGAPYGFTCRTF